jgi:pimeloyl-ACP methyl ester carboxylesterase
MTTTSVQYASTNDGYRIAHRVTGRGTPFVMMPTNWSHFSRFGPTGAQVLWDAFAERFQFIQYDSRGLGSSTRHLRQDVRLGDYAADLHAVIEYLGVGRTILFAMSTFADVALHYARGHPERVSALILFNVSDTRRGWQSEAYLNLARTDWDSFLETAAVMAFGAHGSQSVLPILRDAVTQSDWLKMSESFSRSDALERLSEVHAPTLVIYAARQGVVQETTSRDVATLLPNGRLAVIENDETAGLFPLNGRPPAVLQLIDAFVQELQAEGEARGRVHLTAREVEVL